MRDEKSWAFDSSSDWLLSGSFSSSACRMWGSVLGDGAEKYLRQFEVQGFGLRAFSLTLHIYIHSSHSIAVLSGLRAVLSFGRGNVGSDCLALRFSVEASYLRCSVRLAPC